MSDSSGPDNADARADEDGGQCSPIYTTPPKECQPDDGLVYANLAEITLHNNAELLDRQPFPPRPDLREEPIRVLHNGWREYKTLGGR